MEPGLILILIFFVLRIVGVIVCSSKAKELNRSSGGWGFFGFVSPIIAMIWINCLKPITIWDKDVSKDFYQNYDKPIYKSPKLKSTHRSTSVKPTSEENNTTALFFPVLCLILVIVFFILNQNQKKDEATANTSVDSKSVEAVDTSAVYMNTTEYQVDTTAVVVDTATVFLDSIFDMEPTNISMEGIKLYDSKNSLQKVNLEVIADENSTIKYRTKNGNDFSITMENGKVIYMENDWAENPDGNQPLFSNLLFGETSLNEIREAFWSNGFSYKNRDYFKTDTDIIAFNCYEFNKPNNVVLVTITKVSLTENVNANNIGNKLKLTAIIIADEHYLDRIWGDNKKYDPNYKKIDY